MSSLAATQADGYYLPPEYYESGAKSKNEWYAKQQQQQQQQKKQQKGNSRGKGKKQQQQQTVRFELADPCVCVQCQARIGKGTRFNAVKVATSEMYLSTPIWEFRTTCRRCGNGQFVIRTDPKNRGFVYGGDLRKQDRTWNATEVGGITVQEEEEDDKDDDSDDNHHFNTHMSPVDRLESKTMGLRKAVTERQELQKLIQLNDQTYGDDVTGNAKLRHEFRRGRKVRKRLCQEAARQGWKESLTFVETSVQDTCSAKSKVFGNGKKNETERWKRVREASIFASAAATPVVVPEPVHSAKTRLSGKSPPDQPEQVTTAPRAKRRLVVQGGKGTITAAPPKSSSVGAPQQQQSALASLVAGYASSSEEEE